MARHPLGIGKRWATYPANLCPFLFGAEFSDFGKDLGEAIHQTVEDSAVGAIGKRAAEHFQHMLSGVDSGRWRSGFRNDVDQDYEVMPITIPTRCRSQIATASEW